MRPAACQFLSDTPSPLLLAKDKFICLLALHKACNNTMAGMWGIPSRSAFPVAFAAVLLVCCCFTYTAGTLTSGDMAKLIKQDWAFWGLAGLPRCNNETFLVRASWMGVLVHHLSRQAARAAKRRRRAAPVKAQARGASADVDLS